MSATATPSNIEPGDTILGKYCVERVLGQGGMGCVVAARHVQLGELYAIKLMLRAKLENDNATRRFLREARASARLKGEHVAQVHDVGQTDDGTLFMVMEHLEGTDLKQLLATKGRLSPEDAVNYVLQTCNGLVEAHEMGLVHRDIKPANLFLTRKRRSNEPLVKVLDFGISKDLNLEQSTDLTGSGAVLGSPLYMSPEQLLDSRDVDARTDIWSLGVVLYEFVAGVPPFSGATFAQLALNVMNVAPKSIRQHVPEVSPAFEAVIHRCLAKEPAERYPNIEAFMNALENAAKEGLLRAPNELEAEPTRKNVGQNEVVNPFGPTQDAPGASLADSPQIASNEVVQKNDSGAISDNVHRIDKDAQPMAKTLQSVVPPDLDTTSRPKHRSRLLIGLGIMGAIAVIVFMGRSGFKNNSALDLPASVQVPGEIPKQQATISEHNPDSPIQIVTPVVPSADLATSIRPVESQSPLLPTSASSFVPVSSQTRVNNKKTSPSEGAPTAVPTTPAPAGTGTASPAPTGSGTPGWRQGPL